MSPRAIHFGAGNIGRGFIAPLLTESGYHVIFADVDKEIISELNRQDEYEVVILSTSSRRDSVSNFSGQISTSPCLIDEFVTADLITTSVGFAILPRIAPTIAKGIKLKKRKNPKGLMDVIACENGVGNTEILKAEVIKHLNEDEKKWMETHVGFANCSVDRIVPPFEKDDDPEHSLDVGVEEFYEWVVDQDKLKTDHGIEGMVLASDLLAYVERKLFTLNTAHAITAYLGYIKGYKTVDEALEDPQIHKIVRGALKESGAALLKKHNHFTKEEHEAYIEKILEGRFKNPNIKDEVTRVGRGPRRKLARGDRLVGPALMGLQYGHQLDGYLAKGIAAALWFDHAEDEEAVHVRKLISEKGLEQALREVTGLKDEGHEHELAKAIMCEYDVIKQELKTPSRQGSPKL